MQRRDGDHAVADRREVRAVLLVEARVLAVDPVLRAPGAAVARELQLVAVDALAEARDAHAGRLAERAVDVQQRPGRQRHVVDLVDEARDERARRGRTRTRGRRGSPSRRRGRLLGDRDRRQPEQDALERRGDRAGVRDVVAEVHPVVHARDDELGLEAVDEAERREPHAVHRRAVGGVAVRAVAEVDLLHPQRAARRDRARHRRAVAVGRDDGELDVGHRQQRAAQLLQALRLDAVVVGQQHLHAAPMLDGPSGVARPRRARGRAAARSPPRRPAGGLPAATVKSSSERRPVATSSIVPTSTRFMWRMNVSAVIQNSSRSPSSRHSAASTLRSKRVWYVSVGVNAVKSCVPASARAQAFSASRSRSQPCQCARPASHTERARRCSSR